jgi:transcription initiation factor TFIIB
MKQRLYRLRKWNVRCPRNYISIDENDQNSRNMRIAMRQLRVITGQLHLPRAVAETAAVVYRKALTMNLVQGRSIQQMVSGSVYLACRMRRQAITLRDLSGVSPYSHHVIGRISRLLMQELSIVVPPQDPRIYLNRFCTELGLPAAVSSKVHRIATPLSSAPEIQGKNPLAIAATLIYLTLRNSTHSRSQRQIAETTGISVVTIRNQSKLLILLIGQE